MATTIYHESDAETERLTGKTIAVVGYGNQGRPWALNLRDSGCDVEVCVRHDETREKAVEDGFAASGLEAASDADIACVLIPDDAIPSLSLRRPDDGLTIVASGYTLAFDRLASAGDLGMVAPRMLGPEVRRCYEEGTGFITAVGIHRDATGEALANTLAVAHAIGGLREGAIGLTPMQEAVLDLAVEQLLSPALTHVNTAFVATMLGEGIPLEAIMTELFLSGEVERNYRLLREVGFTGQLGFHSPASQYGQLSRRGRYDSLDFSGIMKELVQYISSGAFADEWDAESAAGHPKLDALRELHAGPGIRAMEAQLRERLGPKDRKQSKNASEDVSPTRGVGGSLEFQISQVSADALPTYAGVSIAFTAESVYRVENQDDGLGGLHLSLETVDAFSKDYDRDRRSRYRAGELGAGLRSDQLGLLSCTKRRRGRRGGGSSMGHTRGRHARAAGRSRGALGSSSRPCQARIWSGPRAIRSRRGLGPFQGRTSVQGRDAECERAGLLLLRANGL